MRDTVSLGLVIPTKLLAERSKVRRHDLLQRLLADLHVIARNPPKLEGTLAIKFAETEPVIPVEVSVAEGSDICAVDFLEPGGLLGDKSSIVLEHDHDEVGERREVLLVRRVLGRSLVIDIGEVVRVLEIFIIGLRITVVLRRHNPTLDERRPGVKPQQRHGTLAQEVGVAARLELGNSQMRATVCHQAADGRVVASLNVAAEEHASLGEAEGVDCRGRGENGVCREGGAHFFELGRDVAVERGRSISVAVLAELDVVDKGSWVHGFGEFSNRLHAFASEGVPEA